MSGDRRRNPRSPVRLRVEIHAGAAYSHTAAVADLSDDGMFVLAPPTLSPGSRATIRFTHPTAGRVVTTRAVVARREGAAGPSDRRGLGLYLVESLASLCSDRRSEERSRATIPARIRVGNMEVAARIVDISDWGAAIDIDLGLKRVPGSGVGGGARRVVPFAHLLREGQALDLGFHHPATRQPVQVGAVLARNSRPVEGRPEYRLGLRFDESLTSLMGLATRSAPPPLRQDNPRITGAADLDRMATRELNMRSLLRAVEWDCEDGASGDGRVVLAGPRKILVATMYDPPPAGQAATIMLQTHDDSSCPPLPIAVEIKQSGRALAAGREPGFVAHVTGFYCEADEQRYAGLVQWLVQGLDG